jgi:hypothetical protein
MRAVLAAPRRLPARYSFSGRDGLTKIVVPREQSAVPAFDFRGLRT